MTPPPEAGAASWFRARAADARRHPFVAAGLVVTAIAVLAIRAADGGAAKAAAYLAAMLACAFATDVVARREGPAPEIPVRRPPRETAVLLVLLAIGAGGLVWSKMFPASFGGVARLPRLAVMLLALSCLFQALPAAYLLASRYKLRDLALVPRGLYAAPAVLVIVAATAMSADPGGVTLGRILDEMGWTGLLAFAFFGEPLFEEFLRMTLQTRVGALLRNRAAGWFLAALPWALLHVPVWSSQGAGLAGASASALCIVPIGLMWSYLTLRTGSLWPALLAHGFNVWGLQNSASR